MAGSKFQYDESGGTFFYFLLSFFALILIPASYYFWPKTPSHGKESSKSSKKCQCELCQLKENRLASKEPQKKTKQKLVKLFIIFGWLAFFAIAYKVAHLERDFIDWDPFEILQIDRGASQAEIKRAYRKLSLVYHPDKDTGDAKKFLQLTKAHAALTDDEARKNWEIYGNPDGPGAMSFGIALPSWIVEKENSLWVLGLYALVFMVTLPTVVGIWWRRSIKFSEDQVLLGTKQIYYYFVSRTPLMSIKRLLMILAASLEFYKHHNSEIIERPSDNFEVPKVMKEFSNFYEKNKEVPLCYAYSVKARVLIFAHLSRIQLNPSTLGMDKMYIVKKCPFLIHGLVLSIYQILTLALSGHVREIPRLETLENCMRLSPMIVQALWDHKSPLLQLPHIREDMLRHLRQVRSIYGLANLKDSERRHLLRSLTDEEYGDVMTVSGQMPSVHMKVKAEVLGDVDPSMITAGAVVTATIFLTRSSLARMLRSAESAEQNGYEEVSHSKAEDEDAESENKNNRQKRRGKGGRAANKSQQLNHTKKNQNQNSSIDKERAGSRRQYIDSESDNSSLNSDSERESNDRFGSSVARAIDNMSDADIDDDDHLWKTTQVTHGKKEKTIETKSKISHTVHCPLYPEEKQEYWWLYIVDLKLNYIVTAPHYITDLVDKTQVQLKFPAPDKVGVRQYTVHLRSDSYLDCDKTNSFKLNVKPAKEIPPEELQYGISEDEKEDEDDRTKFSGDSSDDDAVAISDDDSD